MSAAIYNKEQFFDTLQKLHNKFKNVEKIQDIDSGYTFKTTSDAVDFGTTISVVVEKDNSELFTLNMTKYDEEAFKKSVTQPCKWDAYEREAWEQSEFNSFLVNKGLYNIYEITVLHNGKLLKDEGFDGENDEYAIDDLLFSVDFYDLIHSTYYSGAVAEQNRIIKKIKP